MNTKESPKVGIVLTAGYINLRQQKEAASLLGKSVPERKTQPPNSGGITRVAAASFALKSGLIDKAVVVGGMPDEMAHPVENATREKLAWYAGEKHEADILLLSRRKITTETMGDLRQATAILKSLGLDRNLAIISDRAHLFPRTVVIMHLLGYHRVKFYSTEFLLGQVAQRAFHETGIKVPVLAGYEGIATLLKTELPVTAILLLDLIPDGKNRGSRFIEQKATRERVKKPYDLS